MTTVTLGEMTTADLRERIAKANIAIDRRKEDGQTAVAQLLMAERDAAVAELARRQGAPTTELTTAMDAVPAESQPAGVVDVPTPSTHVDGARFFPGVSADEYHERTIGEASVTAMKELLRSPAHYRSWLAGDRFKRSKALDFGQAFHVAILEPQVFVDSWAIQPDFGDCRRTDNKRARDEWRAAHVGKHVVEEKDAATILAMRESILAHPIGRRLLTTEGECELTARWIDEETGIACKARADKLVRAWGVTTAIDLKSAENASPEGFAKACANLRYHLQDSHYRDGFEADHFIFVAVEKEPPYAVGVYELDHEAIETGEMMRRDALARLRHCLDTDEWPAYGLGIQRLELPRWAVRRN